MSWSQVGGEHPITRFSQIPVCRLKGALRSGGFWVANALPIWTSRGPALVTARHVIDDIDSAFVGSVGKSAAVDDFDLPIPPRCWTVSSDVDVAVALLEPGALEPWHLWDIESIRVMPPKPGDHSESVLIGIVSFPDAGIRPQFVTTAQAVPWWRVGDVDLSEYVVDIVSLEGSSGSPVFLSTDDGVAFAGIVTGEAETENGQRCSTVLASEFVVEHVRSAIARSS